VVLLPAGGGEGVELGAAVVFRLSPLRLNEALMLHAVESDVERSLRDFETSAGDLLDAEQDSVAVECAKGDGLEDEDLEGSLKEIDFFAAHYFLLFGIGEYSGADVRVNCVVVIARAYAGGNGVLPADRGGTASL